jgi:hypothetical protein
VALFWARVKPQLFLELVGLLNRALAAASVAAATAIAAADYVELVHGCSFLSYQGKWEMNRKFSIY